mgnify:CR=1 FL=1
MPRLLFEKTGNAIWISHLDLMRLFQRAFKRAGLNLKHTQGFSPRAMVSIALPLSLGSGSVCEILDFELVGQEELTCEEIKEKLNRALPGGVRVRECYESDRKIKHLTHLDVAIFLEYDNGIPAGAAEAIAELLSRESLIVTKRGKNGPTEQDIIPMIRSLQLDCGDSNTLTMEAVVCCQNPSLNPMQLVQAIDKYLPELKPDFVRCCRMELYDSENTIFR